jgi:hypothetical protein
VYFSNLRFLLTRIIIGLAFRNPHTGVKRLTLRGMVDLQNRVPCHSLAPETSDGDRLEGPVLRLPSTGVLHGSQKLSFFSLLNGKFPPSSFPLSAQADIGLDNLV